MYRVLPAEQRGRIREKPWDLPQVGVFAIVLRKTADVFRCLKSCLQTIVCTIALIASTDEVTIFHGQLSVFPN